MDFPGGAHAGDAVASALSEERGPSPEPIAADTFADEAQEICSTNHHVAFAKAAGTSEGRAAAAGAPYVSPVQLFTGGPITLRDAAALADAYPEKAGSPYDRRVADATGSHHGQRHSPPAAYSRPSPVSSAYDTVAAGGRRQVATPDATHKSAGVFRAAGTGTTLKLRHGPRARLGASPDNVGPLRANTYAAEGGMSANGYTRQTTASAIGVPEESPSRAGKPTPSLSAAYTIGLNDWVLPLRKPPQPSRDVPSASPPAEHEYRGSSAVGAVSALKAGSTKTTAEENSDAHECSAHVLFAPPPAEVLPATATGGLEEGLTLADLKQVMLGFASAPASQDAEMIEKLEAHVDEMSASESPHRTAAEDAEPSVSAQTSPSGSSPLYGRTSTDEGTAAKSPSSRAASASAPGLPRPDSGLRDLRPLPSSADALTTLLTSAENDDKSTVEPRQSRPTSSSDRYRAGSSKRSPPTAYDRALNEAEFTSLIQRVMMDGSGAAKRGDRSRVPVKLSEIHELFDKTDYEAHGFVTWNELATFLTSQSRHRTHVSRLNIQYSEKPDPPAAAASTARHPQPITCLTVGADKKVILTGSADGSVHAWGRRTLAHRGTVFVTPDKDWLVGVHCGGYRSRLLFLTTMSRRVYVLDSNTFEVFCCYAGRALDDSSPSVLYAYDSSRTVRVGGLVAAQPASAPLQGRSTKLTGGSTGHPSTSATAKQTADGDAAPITGRGTGPYVERRVPENAIVGVVDSVTASTHHFSALDEDVLLLGTTQGDVYLVTIPAKSSKKVLVPSHVLHVHRGAAVNKLELVVSLDALFSAGDDGRVAMTSMVTGDTLREFYAAGSPQQHAAVLDFAVAPQLRMLVTVGPERHGLVWDFSQASPTAVLDAHNSPCRCCAIVTTEQSHKSAEPQEGNGSYPTHIMTAAVDGSILLFDTSGFHRMQTIHPLPSHAGGQRGGSEEAGKTAGAGEPGPRDQPAACQDVAGASASPSCDVDHTTQLLVCEEGRRSVLCVSRYPYRLQMKRQVTATCPSRYHGHSVPSMLAVLYTRAFDLLVSVDTEATAMTWKRADGRNVFALSLDDFSESAAMNDSKLTTVGMDAMQRRMLTGFRNGAVVVWNVANGQPINFITAGMRGCSPVPTGAEEASGKGDASHGGSGGARASPAMSSLSAASREVTAVASLVRHRASCFLFAIHGTVYAVKEDPAAFTIATVMVTWSVPEAHGAVLALLPVSPQIVACGTVAGSLLFFNVLTGKQEGAALWIKDGVPARPTDSATAGFHAFGGVHSDRETSPLRMTTRQDRGTTANQMTMRRSSSTGSVLDVLARGSRARADPEPAASYTTARMRSTFGGNTEPTAPTFTGVIQTQSTPEVPLSSAVGAGLVKLIPLPHVHPHLLLSVYADGTVALWHALRKAFLGSVSLFAAPRDASIVTSGNGGDWEETEARGRGYAGESLRDEEGEQPEEPESVVVDVNASNDTLVFADEHGFVHVCAMHFCAVGRAPAEETATLSFVNPAWITRTDENTRRRCGLDVEPQTALDGLQDGAAGAHGEDPDENLARGPQDVAVSFAVDEESVAGGSTAVPSVDAERQLFVFDRFERVRVFPSGMASLCSLLAVDPPASTAPSKPPEAATACPAAQPTLVVCCSAESQFTRVLTLDGCPVGELGLDPWVLGDSRSYRRLGEPVAPPVRDTEEQTSPLVDSQAAVSPFATAGSNANRQYYDFLTEGLRDYQFQQTQERAAGGAFSATLRATVGRASASASACRRRATALDSSMVSLPVHEGNVSGPSGRAEQRTSTAPVTLAATLMRQVSVAVPGPTATAVAPGMSVEAATPASGVAACYLSPQALECNATAVSPAYVERPVSTLMVRSTKDSAMSAKALRPAYARQLQLDRTRRLHEKASVSAERPPPPQQQQQPPLTDSTLTKNTDRMFEGSLISPPRASNGASFVHLDSDSNNNSSNSNSTRHGRPAQEECTSAGRRATGEQGEEEEVRTAAAAALGNAAAKAFVARLDSLQPGAVRSPSTSFSPSGQRPTTSTYHAKRQSVQRGSVMGEQMPTDPAAPTDADTASAVHLGEAACTSGPAASVGPVTERRPTLPGCEAVTWSAVVGASSVAVTEKPAVCVDVPEIGAPLHSEESDTALTPPLSPSHTSAASLAPLTTPSARSTSPADHSPSLSQPTVRRMPMRRLHGACARAGAATSYSISPASSLSAFPMPGRSVRPSNALPAHVVVDDGALYRGAGTSTAAVQRRLIEAYLGSRESQLLDSLGVATAAAASLPTVHAEIGNAHPSSRDETAADSLPNPTALARGTGAAAAHSFVTTVAARMYVAPVMELEPPVGSRSREDAKVWRDHLKRLQTGGSASGGHAVRTKARDASTSSEPPPLRHRPPM